MGRKRSERGRKKNEGPKVVPPPSSTESPAANSATVAWMLSMLATLGAEGLGLVTRVALAWYPSPRLQILSGTLLLVAVLSGLINLVLTGITLKVRRQPPPRPIVVLALVSGCVPIVTTLLLVWR